ncbi:MAG: High-affinity branched-chain amino acid ABC transporter ATP-binding protein LivG [Actinobacteria bacterium]|nr:High-affinity branched-chain amino acid ABC transporter ATP-binding protein LivG [Actinomycetota bacterium]
MMLEAKGLTKHFGGIMALNGVDLHLRKGELAGLIGPNGSGKTTVFNLVTGIYRPDRGSVSIEGKPIVGLAPHRIHHLGVSRTFQNIRLFRNLTVMDNVRTAFHPRIGYGPLSALWRGGKYREGEREIRNKTLDLLALFSLQVRKDEIARNLPYGDQKRLEIARAVASGPKVLLLDEPAAGMNPSEVRALTDFLLEIRRRFDLTILLIEHQMRLAMGICERLVVLDFGEVIAEGTPNEIRNDPRVVEAYLGRGSERLQ